MRRSFQVPACCLIDSAFPLRCGSLSFFCGVIAPSGLPIGISGEWIVMKLMRGLIAMLFVLPFLAMQGQAQEYRLKPGDVLQIEVLEDNTLNRTAIVLPDGNISLPLVGSVPAAGRSLAQVQGELASQLALSFATPPTVYVTLSALAERVPAGAPRTIDVFIVGAANSPGRIEMSPGATLLQAVAQAGGLSPFAAKKRIQLRRVDKQGNEKVYPLNFDAIEQGVGQGGAMRMADGDVIIVPQRKLFE
ncbi:MAG: sugar transporter [Rhodobacter sp.]|nr:sugar transporter [Rhodobacter sp.]